MGYFGVGKSVGVGAGFDDVTAERESVHDRCCTLFADMVTTAEKEQLTYQGFLAELLLAECDDRARRRSVRRVKAAGFPREKWLGDFDFEANPNINPATIHTLATSAWVRAGQPLCLIGDSGTGKSHLLIALGTAAPPSRYTAPTPCAFRSLWSVEKTGA